MLSSLSAQAANPAPSLPDADLTDPIIQAQQRFEQMVSYQVRLRSQSAQGDSTLMRYSYRKPGLVRMDFTEPHPGAVLIYNPDKGKVRVWPFGIGRLPVVSLLPTNSLVQDPNGHRVDQSDIGFLLRNIRHLQQAGKTDVIGEETLAGQKVLHVSVVGANAATIGNVHRYDIWLAGSPGFPVKVISYAVDDKLLESVVMDALVFNVQFPSDFFTP
ncbi:LolA family protein [Serratia sp. L9]|uniref:LolA family protein n=1 Tax=Serratia sp. L9 TaxID=3423946 RepID=UPI003D6764E3